MLLSKQFKLPFLTRILNTQGLGHFTSESDYHIPPLNLTVVDSAPWLVSTLIHPDPWGRGS
jgi:hypothetical protein